MNDLLDGLEKSKLVSSLALTLGQRLEAFDALALDVNIVGVLLAAGPISSVSLKGPGRWSNALWDGVKAEARNFLCTDSKDYADLRSEWDALKKKGSGVSVAALSGVIGARLGVAAGVLAPMVIWILLVGLRIGKNGLCLALSETPSQSPPTI